MSEYEEHDDERLVVGLFKGSDCIPYAFFVDNLVYSVVKAEQKRAQNEVHADYHDKVERSFYECNCGWLCICALLQYFQVVNSVGKPDEQGQLEGEEHLECVYRGGYCVFLD